MNHHCRFRIFHLDNADIFGLKKYMGRAEAPFWNRNHGLAGLSLHVIGEVAVRAWTSLQGFTGREHTHLAIPKEDEKIRFRDVVAQPRKIISSPIWSGLESEKVCYNAGYTNVHELIPWRTLTGRQQFYQDHLWMRAFGEALVTWRPPVDTKGTALIRGRRSPPEATPTATR